MSVTIDGFVIDVVVSMERARTAEATQWPVGVDPADPNRIKTFTDNVRIIPATVTLEGVVSDAPLSEISAKRASGVKPSHEASERLNKLFDETRAVEIRTDRGVYQNMLMTSYSEPRDAKTGESLRFKATFTEINVVTSERSVVKITLPRAKKKTKNGSKSADEVKNGSDDADDVTNRLKDYAAGRRSILGDIVHSI